VNLWQQWRFQKGDSDNGEKGFCSRENKRIKNEEKKR
jgi:hypothetical protein